MCYEIIPKEVQKLKYNFLKFCCFKSPMHLTHEASSLFLEVTLHSALSLAQRWT